jgi:hypothetical protein
MRLEEKLKRFSSDKIWDEYCGFLDMSLSDYMFVQNRLMKEQMDKWCKSGLGKLLIGDFIPETIDEFRERMPLTKYEDYAEILLNKRDDMLPSLP